MQDLTAYMQDTIAVLRATAGEGLEKAMRAAIEAVVVALEQGHPVLIAGNGGSASDAMHIAGELVGRYKRERRGLNVIALSANPAVLTAGPTITITRRFFPARLRRMAAPGAFSWVFRLAEIQKISLQHLPPQRISA